jgi:hypothetical protein
VSELYGVCFDDGPDTYLIAVCDVMSEAEREMERREEERFVREVEEGGLEEEDFKEIYYIKEIEEKWLTEYAQDQLERGFVVRFT